MDSEQVLEIHIREDDPLFGRAQELANEVVAALTFWVVQPLGDGAYSLPTLASVVTEIDHHPDMSLLGLFVFALGRSARNMVTALAAERDCTAEEVLSEFLMRPAR